MTAQPPDFRALCAKLLKVSLRLVEAPPLTSSEETSAWDVCCRARAALSTPPLAPIPVSERLPGAKDLKGGYCWFWHPDNDVTYEHWVFAPADIAAPECFYWLPHWAIPLPEVQK
jgi:hypothetical protein